MTNENPPGVRVAYRLRGGNQRIAWVTIDNPRRLNCLGSGLMREFVEVFESLAEDDDLRAVVLGGAGPKAFVGGADIDEMAGLDAPRGRAFISAVHACCDAVRRLPVPVIARIHGFALGAGLELAAACDLRIGSRSARLGMPETRLGIPSVVEAALLPGLIGWGRTRRLLLLGELLEPEQAEQWGLLERVVADDALDAAVDEWLDLLLLSAPQAIRLQKSLIRQWEDLPTSSAIRAGIDSFEQAWGTDEPGEVMAEFQAQRRRGSKAL